MKTLTTEETRKILGAEKPIKLFPHQQRVMNFLQLHAAGLAIYWSRNTGKTK